VIQDRVVPVQVGSCVRVNDLVVAPPRLEATLAFLQDRVVPAVRALNGYRATLVGINRATRRMLVRSVWETAADREASNAG
jgi:hypothetical protein